MACVLISVLWCSPGLAAEQTLLNDSFSGSGSVLCISGQGFAAGEIAAARFTPPPGSHPFQILAVQVLACPLGTQADLVLKIWRDERRMPFIVATPTASPPTVMPPPKRSDRINPSVDMMIPDPTHPTTKPRNMMFGE